MLTRCFVIGLSIWAFLPLANPLQAQPASSSACSLEGPNNCQLFDGSTNRTPSDRSVVNGGIWTADDFVPQSDTLQSLCVWGQYINADPEAVDVDCASVAAADSFLIKVFANGNDLPASPVLWSTATSTRTPAFVNRNTTDSAAIYKFELVLDAPISGLITDGRAYWLEVTNWSSTQTSFYCYWHWSQLSANSVAGNRYSAKGREWGYGPFDERAVDYAFCMNLDIAPGGMAPVAHPCCRCDGSCELNTLVDCDQLGGTWNVTLDTCASVSCPSGAPANDTCSMLQAVTPGAFLFNTACAGTELVSPVETELGPAPVGKDLWFSYDHEFGCDLTFYTCYSRFDTVIALYFDPDNPDVCPCPTDENLETFLVASDEGCTYAVLGEGALIQLESGCDFAPFGCYTIRIGGFNDDSGIVNLDVSCTQSDPSSPTPIVDSSAAKTRFISFSVPPGGGGPCGLPGAGQLAIRVTLTSLHHVDPPYTSGVSTPFTAFEGQSRWVGPPAQYVESNANPVPYFASTLQCIPHYRDWSTVPLLHVTGSAIVPSSIYHVETVSGNCQGQENTPSCQSGAVNVSPAVEIKTARWADVEVPYNPPSATAQPDVGDIAALVKKFRDRDNPPSKARCLLAGNDAFGKFNTATLANDMNFSHIAICVDAFRGAPYPFKMGMCAGAPTSPASGACTTDADCVGANGTPPCKLFAMGKCTGSPNGDCTSDAQCFAGGANGAPPCIRFFECP